MMMRDFDRAFDDIKKTVRTQDERNGDLQMRIKEHEKELEILRKFKEKNKT
jgi:hypothetical protein